MDKVRLETTGTIELTQFIRPDELDPILLEAPHFLGPDGPVAEESFAVLRKALARSRRIGIGQVVMGGKEKLVALKSLENGFVLYTLRYASELKAADEYFEPVQESLDETQVALAQKLIESKSAPLKLSSFTDRYQTALLELIKAKVEGTEPVVMPRNGAVQAINLLDALRQSLAQTKPNGVVVSRSASHQRKNGMPRSNGKHRRCQPAKRQHYEVA